MQELQKMKMPAGGGLDRPRPKLDCSAIEEKQLRNCLLHREHCLTQDTELFEI